MNDERKTILQAKICERTGFPMKLVAEFTLNEIDGELYAETDYSTKRWEIIT